MSDTENEKLQRLKVRHEQAKQQAQAGDLVDGEHYMGIIDKGWSPKDMIVESQRIEAHEDRFMDGDDMIGYR